MSELTAKEINKRLDDLYLAYEEVCQIIKDNDQLYMSLKHDTTNAINAGDASELISPTNQRILQRVEDKEIKALTLTSIDTMIRTECPKLFDNYTNAERIKKQIENQTEMLNNRMIRLMADRKAELLEISNGTSFDDKINVLASEILELKDLISKE